jgi:2-polyprenyl-6-methoxyphenol hydroxylase-like FAD-dependent oxidoreductase
MGIADPGWPSRRVSWWSAAGSQVSATASALLQRGIEADVVERAAAWSDPGTGMYLPANSVRALGSLGLQGPLLDHAYGIKRQLFLDQRGRVLLDVDLRGVWGATGPCVAISHRALHELLREGNS